MILFNKEEVPDRVWYYLLDYKDRGPEDLQGSFYRKSKQELMEIFQRATAVDLEGIDIDPMPTIAKNNGWEPVTNCVSILSQNKPKELHPSLKLCKGSTDDSPHFFKRVAGGHCGICGYGHK